MKKLELIINFTILFYNLQAQNWYKEALRQERMLRPGIGLQGMEGQGILFQLNRGHFCHNSYFPYFIIEFFYTRENTLNIFF